PLFLFAPPMPQYIAALWHVAVANLQACVNLACATLMLLLAAGLFLLGRVYFGRTGGFLCAAAGVYAPYLPLHPYGRAVVNEFPALAFCAWALYGFALFARQGRQRGLVIGALAYAGIVFSHFLVAFYFTPLLAGFLCLEAPRKLWRPSALWLLLGVAL